MDADRIRQALANTIREPDGVVHQSKHRGDQAVIYDAALAYADLLDGPTDEERQTGRAAAYALNSVSLGGRLPTLGDRVDAALEAVFQARKERG